PYECPQFHRAPPRRKGYETTSSQPTPHHFAASQGAGMSDGSSGPPTDQVDGLPSLNRWSHPPSSAARLPLRPRPPRRHEQRRTGRNKLSPPHLITQRITEACA